MAENLFRTELMYPYRIRNSGNYGEWTTRNGTPAMKIGPLPYYNTANTSGSYSYVLHNEFEAGKRYLFDIWMDVDDIVSGGKNVNGGIHVRYTDGTSTSILANSQATSGHSGWIHKMVVTAEGKNVSGFTVSYYTSTPAFYRWDSSISEYENVNFEKNTTANDNILKENSEITSIANGGMINCNGVIEV